MNRSVVKTLCLPAVLVLYCCLVDADSIADHRAATPNEKTGTVEGVVIYQADPARPWRYGRYYV
jgi:hypothetical protein